MAFLKKYQVILVLSAVVMGMWWIRKNYQWKEEVSVAAPTPTGATEEMKDSQYPLWKKLPYFGEGFVVEKYIEPMTLKIESKGLDGEIVEKKVKEWLEENKEASDSHKLVIN